MTTLFKYVTCVAIQVSIVTKPTPDLRTYEGMHDFNEFDYPVQATGAQNFLVRYFLSNCEVSQAQKLNVCVVCLISLNSVSIIQELSIGCGITFGFVFRAFSSFCLQNALIALFSSLPIPPKMCFRIPASVSTARIRLDLWSISVLSSFTGSASGCQRPEPTKDFPPGWMCT